MFPAENLRDRRGEDVVDPDGNKIGELEAVCAHCDLPYQPGALGERRLGRR